LHFSHGRVENGVWWLHFWEVPYFIFIKVNGLYYNNWEYAAEHLHQDERGKWIPYIFQYGVLDTISSDGECNMDQPRGKFKFLACIKEAFGENSETRVIIMIPSSQTLRTSNGRPTLAYPDHVQAIKNELMDVFEM
jgi:hypothetical protein